MRARGCAHTVQRAHSTASTVGAPVRQARWVHCTSSTVGALHIKHGGCIAQQAQWVHCTSSTVGALHSKHGGCTSAAGARAALAGARAALVGARADFWQGQEPLWQEQEPLFGRSPAAEGMSQLERNKAVSRAVQPQGTHKCAHKESITKRSLYLPAWVVSICVCVCV